MIRENQRLLNHLNVLSDAVLTFLALPIAYWIRFFLMPSGVAGIPFQNYLWLAAAFTLVQIFTYALFGLYQSFRKPDSWMSYSGCGRPACWIWFYC